MAITRGWSAGKRYTISQEGHILDKVDGKRVPDHPQRKEEHWNVVIFDLDQEGYPSQKVDLYQAVRSYNPSYFPIMSNHLIHYQEVDYLTVTIRPEGAKDSDKDKKVFLNLETHEISEIPEEYKKINPKFNWIDPSNPTLSSDVNATTLRNIARENGYLLLNLLKNDSSIKDAPKKGSRINLTSENPQVKEILDRGGTVYGRQGVVTSEDWFNHMLHWLAPEGESDLTVYPVDRPYASNAQPLTDYPIQSYQDYLNWKEQQEKKE
ncbi:hypothetical protein MK367_00480 [Streptococcus sanguinis]|uniref:hypothetical protein n=1 Tax=Streptococcus sanguinis TaxID=1305 RepID=UPI00228342B6|nr:hypothetical protein [Streptococcus sanguinis]MCY7025026.1 hypothetical protein [Streptococcus sanguinis]MCY7028299.1 hypothetical protein [Streptococcus sanguinis]